MLIIHVHAKDLNQLQTGWQTKRLEIRKKRLENLHIKMIRKM